MLSYFLLYVFLFDFSFSRAQTCSCTDSTSTAVWISDAFLEPNQTCDERCNGQINMIRLCFTNSTNSTLHCRVGKIDCPACKGNWSVWDNVGKCSNPCGSGMRMQTRICFKYKANFSSPFRSTECEGANGQNEQERWEPCTSIEGCGSTAAITTSTVTIPKPFVSTSIRTSEARATQTSILTRTTTLSTANRTSSKTIQSLETTAPSAIQSQDSETTSGLKKNNFKASSQSSSILITKITSGITSPTYQAPLLPSSAAEYTLPLVLCSVAVICVAVIISFVIVLKRKPQDHIQHNVLVSSTTKDNNNDDDDEKKELHNYEVVGPALPPSRKPKESPEKKSTDISLTVHNVLYSKDEKDSGISLKFSAPPKLDDDEDDSEYLTPMNTSAPKEQPKTPPSKTRMQQKQLITLKGQHPQIKAENGASAQRVESKNNMRASHLTQNVPSAKTASIENGYKAAENPPSPQTGPLHASSKRCYNSNLDDYQMTMNITAQNVNPRPKVLVDSSNYVANVNDVPVVRSKKEDSVSSANPAEGDYIKDISILMKPLDSSKTHQNKDLSNFGYVSIEQLKSRNLI